MTSVTKIKGFVLNGGESSRMGSPKGDLVFKRQKLLERAVQVMKEFTDDDPIVIGGAPTGLSITQTVPDIEGFSSDDRKPGPLVGIATALSVSDSEFTAVLACDMPFMRPSLFGLMVSLIGPDVEAVVPVQDDGRLQPLAAIYRTAVCLERVMEILDLGQRKVTVLLDSVSVRSVLPSEWKALDGSNDLFVNLNTPDDLTGAEGSRSL